MSVINTNVLSMVTQNNMFKSQSALNSAVERLSSGLRINSAKDDAAGQAIANRFTSNIKGLNQASRNANDGISLAQTAEGALTEINSNLQRVRELTVQASNGTNTVADQTSILAEITTRLAEITRTADITDFNGTKLLNAAAATAGTVTIQVGANGSADDRIAISLTDVRSSNLFSVAAGNTALTFTAAGTATVNAAAAATDLTRIDKAIALVDAQRSALGSAQNRLESAVTNIATTVTNLSASLSRIQDANYATEVSNMTRAQIMQQAGTSVLAKANQSTQGVMALLQ